MNSERPATPAAAVSASSTAGAEPRDLGDRRVYFRVLVIEVATLACLWFFSRYFS